MIKRVVGLGGDTLVWDRDGKLQVNGRAIEEPYVRKDDPYPNGYDGTVTIPEGTVFVVGDWRGNSADSRFRSDMPHDGAIPLAAVKGVVVAIGARSLPEVTAFTDAGQPNAPRDAPSASALFWIASSGGVVFLLGTIWLGLRLTRKRAAQ